LLPLAISLVCCRGCSPGEPHKPVDLSHKRRI
jgi:hypothetical protein